MKVVRETLQECAVVARLPPDDTGLRMGRVDDDEATLFRIEQK